VLGDGFAQDDDDEIIREDSNKSAATTHLYGNIAEKDVRKLTEYLQESESVKNSWKLQLYLIKLIKESGVTGAFVEAKGLQILHEWFQKI